MKYFKKLIAAVSAVALALCMGTTAFAAGEGQIVISNATKGQVYSAYKILDLESYNAETGAYSYTADKDWADWLEDQTAYVSINGQGYVSWVEGADAAAFAKDAQAYAKTKGITADATATADGATVTFNNLDLGYYLVDTTLGTVCSLDTTKPKAEITEKNVAPTITKEVQEDSTEGWGAANDADFSQTVNFKATITVQKGAENYVMHDTMSAGLTYVGVTGVTVNGVDVASENYDVVTDADNCTFDVVFDNAYVAGLEPGTEIVVAYSATLNQNAAVGLPGNPNAGNSNEATLEYGDKNQSTTTPKAETITYTWDMEVLKYANGDKDKLLADAKFVLLNNDKSKVASIANGKLVEWVAVEGANLAGYQLTTDAQGKIEIDGLDADTYYLRETAAPAGYNKLADDVEVVVNAAAENNGKLEYTTVIAEVNNNSGVELPSTGGMGTTIMYIAGAALVLIAGVALVVKRRMNASK